MKIIEPSVELLSITPNAEVLIERAGRTCYKSEDKITSESAAEFVKMIMRVGHHSVIEHASATLKFICNRGVTHEFVRHRLMSYSQESTRYCNYSKDKFDNQISFVKPLNMTVEQTWIWKTHCETTERAYLSMIDMGAKPQVARDLLLICLKTEIVATGNLREWRHVLSQRTTIKAHPQICAAMNTAGHILKMYCPTVFSDWKPYIAIDSGQG